MNKKPMIGITGYHILPEEGVGGPLRGLPGQGFHLLGHDYINSVRGAGGIPVGLPVNLHNQEEIAEVVRRMDGFVLSGGEDVDPKRYGEHLDARVQRISLERDEFELRLAREILAQKKPLLGICRGVQLLNVYFGGTLYLDNQDHAKYASEATPAPLSGADADADAVPTADRVPVLAHHIMGPNRWYMSHEVTLLDPRLQSIYGRDVIEVNSFHHQSVHVLGQGLRVGAVAKDGIIESVYHPDYPNLLAVQWHPEMMAEKLEEGFLPFRWLIQQCQ
ncbi:MAG: hypothetical protein A2201_02260 [Alicyclobacillus sp. RIFOXYA1_FULL_53_8]|nr:MAG: hypothetical protein A2201_02260 [Alicyclobacillus sp. RIFOXYA1_FULL_53_8]